MVSCYDDFVFVRQGGEPVYLGLELDYVAGVCEIAGVDEDVAGGDVIGDVCVGVADAYDSDWGSFGRWR